MKRNIFIFLLICMIAMQAWFAHITFSYPFIGVILAEDQQGRWVVRHIEKGSAGEQLDLKVGDDVTEVDGKKPELHFSVMKWRYIEQADTITIMRDGNVFSVKTKGSGTPQFDSMSFIGSIVCSVIGFVILIKLRNSPSAKLLSLVFVTIGNIYMSLGASNRGDELGKIVITGLVALLPFIFLHFLLVFFKEKGNIDLPRKYLKYVYILLSIAFGIRFFYYMPSLSYPLFKLSGPIALIPFLTGFMINIILLIYVYYRYCSQEKYLKSIVRTIGFSFFISFVPITLFSFAPQFITGYGWISPFYTSWFVLFFPFSFTYLIVTKQLYDIDIIMRRVVYSVTIAFVPSVVVAGVEGLIFNYKITTSYYVANFLVTLTVFSFFLYSLEYLTSKLEKVIFPRKYHLQNALKNISKSLGSIQSFREMKDIVLVDIVNTLDVSGGAIAFRNKNEIEVICEGNIERETVEQLIIHSINEKRCSVFEINRHEEYTSYLVVTPKRTNTLLGKEELQWLTLIISYLSVSLENLYLIRKLNMQLHELASQLPNDYQGSDVVWFRKSMFELQESERLRIAADLHDTTMQDIFFVQRKLKAFSRKTLQVEDHKQITEIINHLELINLNLRQCCFELNPHLIENKGFVHAVRKLIDIESNLSDFEIEWITDGDLLIEQCGLETKKHLFRVVQELINNAKKHSNASKVTIRFRTEQQNFYLEYEDNGIGFETDRRDLNGSEKSGIGLDQMRSRVLHVNGEFNISSNRSLGVKVKIKVPLNGGLIA